MDKSFESMTLGYTGEKKLARMLHTRPGKEHKVLMMNYLRVSFGGIPKYCEKAREK